MGVTVTELCRSTIVQRPLWWSSITTMADGRRKTHRAMTHDKVEAKANAWQHEQIFPLTSK